MANLKFPLGGINEGGAVVEQPEDTSPDINNMRPYDTLDNRARGGQRPGLAKWSSNQIGGSEQPIVAMVTVTTTE